MGSQKIEFDEFFSWLVEQGEPVDPGLTEIEFSEIESQFDFKFPPDLREFLSIGLPLGEGWVNWRTNEQGIIGKKLAWPLEGICFDIKHNAFWRKAWGQKPKSVNDQFKIATEAVKHAPALIPIFGHRYIPDRPSHSGNPVLSVYQTDIIYYGNNLKSYLLNEFWRNIHSPDDEDTEYRHIEFWSDVMEEVWN